MFPLPILTYVKIGIVVFSLLFSGYCGYRIGHNQLVAYQQKQAVETAKLEKQQQAQADQIRKEKDAQIASINNQLVDAISQLHNRPNRAQSASNGSCGTGATLSAEDAEFLVREAARADQIRTGLDACYKQYDSIAK